jgi:hypothetical protein
MQLSLVFIVIILLFIKLKVIYIYLLFKSWSCSYYFMKKFKIYQKSMELSIVQPGGWSKVQKSIEIKNKIHKKSLRVGPGWAFQKSTLKIFN